MIPPISLKYFEEELKDYVAYLKLHEYISFLEYFYKILSMPNEYIGEIR